MEFHFSEEQLELKRNARRFLEVQSPAQKVLAATQGSAYDLAIYQRVARELGWTALMIPENYGGLGMSALELHVLMEEMGRHLFSSPYFATVCLAAQTILIGGSDTQKRNWLPPIAAGELTATLALAEPSGSWDINSIQAHYKSESDSYVLYGTKRYVPDGASADLLIVAAREERSVGSQGIALFAVPKNSKNIDIRSLATMDASRKQAEVVLSAVKVPKDARIGEDGLPILKRALDLACIALAAEQVGAAEMCLEMAVEYAKVRKQFDRPIGSFQAIKHKCADMLLRVESARSAAFYASALAAQGHDSLSEAASTAKAYCSDAFFHCAAENIQIHGGIGFTWEHPAHLYFKRAKSDEILLGTPALHRERVCAELGL